MDLEQYLAMLNAPTVPSATEQASWASQRRELATNAANQANQLAYQQGALQTSLGGDTESLAQRYARMRENLPQQYAQRGLGNSGIYGRGLLNLNQDKLSAFKNLYTQYGLQSGNIAQQQRATYASLASGLADVSQSEAARRAELAANIRSL